MKPNALLDGIFENAPYPMWISDNKGTLTRINQACRKLLHIEEEEIVGKYNVFQDDIVREQGFMPLIRRVFEDGKRANFILKYDSSRLKTLNLKETVSLVVDVTVSTVLDARGKVAHVLFQHMDITERLRAEELLRESESKYRSVFETTGTATMIVEEDTTISLTNAEFEKLSGYSREEIEGKKSWTEFVVKEDLERMKGYHYARRNATAPGHYEFRFLDRQGNVKNVFLTVALVAGTKKTVASLLDITKRKRAEEALRESEERWQFALEGSGDGVWDWNPQTNKVHFSRQWKAMLGYEESEISEAFDEWTRLVHPDDYGRAIVEVDKHLQGQTPVYISEHRLLCKGGGYKWILARGKLIRRTEEGKPLRVIGTHTDVTERKRAEEALRASEAKYRLLHESMTDAFGRTDLAGRILEANRAFQSMTGYSEEELRRLNYRDLTPEKWHAAETRIIEEQVLRQGHSQVYEKEFRKKDGTVFPVDLRTFLLRDDAGEASGMWAIVREITERKRVEEALQRSEESARSLAEENAVMAEIGRIISSTLDINEVYERFAAEVKKLVPFDRISIVEAHPSEGTGALVYEAGLKVPARISGDRFQLAGSVTDLLFETKTGVIVQGEEMAKFAKRTPGYLPIYRTGFRSLVAVPLILRDQFVGTFAMNSLHPDSYSDRHLKIAERIANQIAGAVANARLYLERKRGEEELRRSEEKARRLAAENEAVAEIGRIISSTINIEEVYERFAQETKKIIRFDRVTVSVFDPEIKHYSILYTSGDEVPGFHKGAGHPIRYESLEMAGRVRPGIIFQLSAEKEARAEEEIERQFPSFLTFYRAGLRSIMRTPLISKDQTIGSLNFLSQEYEAYTESDLRVAERIANQIAGTVANAQLFQQQKRTEDELRRSEERARRLVVENEVVAEIGRIISSSVNLDDVYESFAQEAKKIIRFDRITISLPDPEEKTFTIPYASGVDVPGYRKGDSHPIPQELYERAGRVRPGVIFHASAKDEARNEEEIQRQISSFLPSYRAGLRSIMRTPLLSILSKDRPIGVLSFFSREYEAYTESDLRVAERIANQIAGAVASALLFQKQKRTEEELFNSSEQYRRLVDLSPMLITLINKEGKYVYMNPAALKTIGASKPEEMLGRPVLDITHPDSIDAAHEVMRLMQEGKTVPVFRQKCVRLDQKVIEVELNQIQAFGRDEETVMVVGRDITEQAKTEREKAVLQEQLQQAQKMEAIGTLAGGIAHDFNNILAAILGYAELAGLDIPEDSKARYNLQQSIKSAHRAKDLVQQILAFSRQGKQDRKPLDIRPIVKEGLKFLRSSLPTTIEIRQEIEEDLGLIEANPTQVYQVLMNLCTNAAHAMADHGGVLEVSLNKEDLEAGIFTPSMGAEPGSYLRLRVRDTGHGMSPDILKKIFDPYFTTKEVGKGTGLGLSVVHGIVKSYGGGIAVSSEAGRGSTFDIYFPRIETPSSALEAAKAEPLPLGGHERVLFVDDEQTIVEVGQNILEYLGYEVEARTSSIEALELFKEAPERFDLVITDMTMPNLTGDKLAQMILAIRPGIPIVLCTGFSESVSEERAKALGVRDFVLKPLVIRDLAQTIRKALDSREKKRRGR